MLKLAEPPAGEDDDRALAEAAGGDDVAFGSLVRRYQGLVFSLAHRFLRDRAAAEDLAQEVFLELYRNLPSLRSTAHMRFWLRRVACHRCIDQLRKTSSQPETPLEAVSEPVVAPASRDVLLDERLRELVAQLPARPRMVVVLRYQEDLEPSEIAAVLDMPVNTVKSHLRRSISALREQLSTRMLHEV
jgi:RNA polymerase sigma-70 factor (ECF subfamily)